MTRNPSNAVDLRLFDPREGDLPFRLLPLDAETLRQPQRSNYFNIVWVREGHGEFHPDLACHRFHGPVLLFSNPYQTLFLTPGSALSGTIIQFHPNFFCIETHHEEVGCNGVLFNDQYGEPQVGTDAVMAAEIESWLGQMKEEARSVGLAQSEILVSLLKILLIKAARLKLEGGSLGERVSGAGRPDSVARLMELIERNYQTLHRPGDYASLLAMTPKALGKLVKKTLGKTLHPCDPREVAQTRKMAAAPHAPAGEGDRG